MDARQEIAELLRRYFLRNITAEYDDCVDENGKLTEYGKEAYEDMVYVMYEIGRLTEYKNAMGDITNELDMIMGVHYE